jgi:hypothetical protein
MHRPHEGLRSVPEVREAASRLPDGPAGAPGEEWLPLQRSRRSTDPVAGASPSFDCNKATTPSQIEICRSPRLAELDNILAAGYAFIKTTQGRPAADAIGILYWKAIAQCDGYEACIAQRQSEEIATLANAGAPGSLPA